MTDAAKRELKLTAKERHALAELAKPMGQRDYRNVHGRTIHALERKGLFGCLSDGRPGGALTSAGLAALVVPDIFDDLFDEKAASMPKTKSTKSESSDAFRTIDHVETTLYDTVRDRWEEGTDQDGVRLYCTQSPKMFDQPGREGARWSLQVRAWVKTKGGARGKHFAIGTASMSRGDLAWLRDQINAELRRK